MTGKTRLQALASLKPEDRDEILRDYVYLQELESMFERMKGQEPYIRWSQMQVLIMSAIEIEGSQKAAAKTFGVSSQFLNDVVRGRREPTDKIANWFGMERVVVFMPVMGAKIGDHLIK